MSLKSLKIVAITLSAIGMFLLVNSKVNITGMPVINVVGSPTYLTFIVVVIILVISIILFTVGKSPLEEIVQRYSWRKYKVNPHSIIGDIEEEYLSKIKLYSLTPAQEAIERRLTGGRLINDQKNKKSGYKEQFYEGHAAQGGRIIDIETHIVKTKEDVKRLVGRTARNGLNYYEGRLIHFGCPANGRYLWIVDEDGNFILGNRQTFQHEMSQMNQQRLDLDHRHHKLPHATLARGKRIYGSGEVLIEGGLVREYNTASGHYVNLRDIASFNQQGKEVFEFFTKKIGWKEVKNGAKYES